MNVLYADGRCTDLVSRFVSQLQYRNENQIFISNFVFQFNKKMKWHIRYTDFSDHKNTAFFGNFC